MTYLIAFLGAYLLGCSNLTYYIARAKGLNVRDKGTGNLGASNATILIGWGAGIAVAIHDIGKATLAVVLANFLFPEAPHIGAVAGVASVLGHIFPFYLGFRGGKGFASYFGMVLGLNWKFALILGVVIIAVTLISDYIVLGTFTTISASPIVLGLLSGSLVLPLILLVGSAVILYKHRENIVRLRNGTEIGLRSTAKGEHRIK